MECLEQKINAHAGQSVRLRLGEGRVVSALVLSVGLASLSCAFLSQSAESTRLVFDLAHNTERTRILAETSTVLQLNNFTLEYSDAGRNQAALRTNWRQGMLPAEGDDQGKMWIRDRAILHISPRGKSAISPDAYQMVIAKLEFEVEMKANERGAWKAVPPSDVFREYYSSIVTDIRNRMLKYRYEF